jgi:indolepyruvate ferredoxin oxidoreductase beta subunit
MKCDIILAGVGGQGVLSIGAIIAATALKQELTVKQSEVHGMAQRGGAVQAHLRLADRPIHSDLVPMGTADMVVSLEPLESLRYVSFLSPDGFLLTAGDPVRNISNYPDLDALLGDIRALPHARVIEAEALARKAGSGLATNMVMVGAASHHLPLEAAALEKRIAEAFARKGDKIVRINLAAFRYGREAAASVPS